MSWKCPGWACMAPRSPLDHRVTASAPSRTAMLGLARIAAIGGKRGAHALVQHPAQHLARIGRELDLQQLLPHLLLAAAQIGDVIGEAQRPGQKPAAEIQQQVEGLANLRAAAEEIAEIDQAVARR